MRLRGPKTGSLTLLAIILAFAGGPTFANSTNGYSEIDSAALITTSTYDPRQEQGRGFKAFFSGIGAFFFGPSADLAKTVESKLENPALRTYFPNASERHRISQNLGAEAKNRILSHGYNNQTVDSAMKFLTDQLVSVIVERVLKDEGVRDKKRAQAWAKKILAPFDRCMNLTSSYGEASKCGQPLENDLIKNVGLALSIELPMQEFHIASHPADYKRCLRMNATGVDGRVRNCALNSVRIAASAYGRSAVRKAASKELAMKDAEYIVNQATPSFDSCLKTAKERSGFESCGDKLIGSAGASIAETVVLKDPRVRTAFPQESDRQALAMSAQHKFQDCINENIRAKHRDVTGAIAIDNCANFVTLETAHQVALASINSTISRNIESPSERDTIGKRATKELNACWNSNSSQQANSTCLRESVKKVALEMAGSKLKTSLPADIHDPKLGQNILRDFSTCLDQSLPADPIRKNGTAAAVSKCSNTAYRSATLAVADSRVRSALKDEISDNGTADRIVAKLVHISFDQCIGDSPDLAKISSCSVALEKNVAAEVAATLIPARLNEFLEKGGGAAAYGLNSQSQEALSNDALIANQQCLNDTSQSKSTLDAEVSACFKGTVHDLALKLGALELQKTARSNGVDVSSSDFQATSSNMQNDLGVCLDQKKDKQFALKDYMGGINDCEKRIGKSTTKEIAKSQLSSKIEEVLGDAGKDLEVKLIADLDDCLAKANGMADNTKCLNDLRGSAVSQTAKQATHQRALKQLATDTIPPELVSLDQTLDSCAMNSSKSPSDCAVTYAKDSTKAIGHLDLGTQLKKQFGETKFAELSPDIAKLEAPFGDCVDKAPSSLDKKMIDALGDCGTQLAGKAAGFVISQMASSLLHFSWSKPTAPPPPHSAPKASVFPPVDQHQLADDMTRTILCVNGSLDPSETDALKNLEAGSIEEKLLKLLGGYVNYDSTRADKQFSDMLTEVSKEWKTAGADSARKKLLEVFANSGMADQLLKSMVKESFSGLSGKVSAEIAKKLSDKANLDSALSDESLATLRPFLLSGMLEPVLVEGKALDSSSVLHAYRDIRSRAIDTVLASSVLGFDDATKEKIRAAL